MLLVCLTLGEKKKTKVIDNNLDPEWNEVSQRVGRPIDMDQNTSSPPDTDLDPPSTTVWL